MWGWKAGDGADQWLPEHGETLTWPPGSRKGAWPRLNEGQLGRGKP